ncbi:cylicin-2-like isoform X1 [Branchiostoma lanceolatum]|uniref:cylicin-2-like isoform X1 n=1 Tax=Branchiostoma lanceolatum TaxID=7740 RepID=UPI0034530A78
MGDKEVLIGKKPSLSRRSSQQRLKKRRPSVSTISETGSLSIDGTSLARLPLPGDRQQRPVMDKLSRQVSIMKSSGTGKRSSGRKVSILDPKSLSEGPVEGIKNPALDESGEATEQPEAQGESGTPAAEEAALPGAGENGTGSKTDQEGRTEGAEIDKEGDKQEVKEEGQQEEEQEDKSKSSDKKKSKKESKKGSKKEKKESRLKSFKKSFLRKSSKKKGEDDEDAEKAEADIPLVDIDAAEAQQSQRKKGKRPFVIRRGGDDDEMKQVIPYMPLPLAIVCCLLNIFLPGFGTLLSGFCLLCKWGVRDPNAGPNQKDEDLGHALYLNVVVALSQMITITFMLVGYFWSVAWGAQMVRMAVELRRWKKGQPQFKGQVMVVDDDDDEGAVKTQPSTKGRQSSQGAPSIP